MTHPNSIVTPRRIAVVLNGDTEDHHRRNVKLSVEALKADGFEVFVASTENPGVSKGHYVDASKTHINTLLNHLKKTGRSSDELVIYTTGHGSFSVDDELIALPGHKNHKALGKQLDSIPYGKRTVVMDQCFGGSSTKRFLDNPRTLFISAGAGNEKVKCQEFAPHFWAAQKNVPDRNHDNHIAWDERFAYMKGHFAWGSQPLYLASAGYALSGMPQRGAFERMVITVNSQQDLDQQLARLKKDGEYAVITFSATWCGPCKKYRPEFEKMANVADGHILFLRTENEELAGQYGVTGFPTIKGMKYGGELLTIEDRHAVMEELAVMANPTSIIDVLKRKKVAVEDFFEKLPQRATKMLTTNALKYMSAAQELPPSPERDNALHKTIVAYLKVTSKPALACKIVFPFLNQIADPKMQGECRDQVYAMIAQQPGEMEMEGLGVYPTVIEEVMAQAVTLKNLHNDGVKKTLLHFILNNKTLRDMTLEEAGHYLDAANSLKDPGDRVHMVLLIAERVIKQGHYEMVTRCLNSAYQGVSSQDLEPYLGRMNMLLNRMGFVENEVIAFNEKVAAERRAEDPFDRLCLMYSMAFTKSVNKDFSPQINRAFVPIAEALYSELLALAAKRGEDSVEGVKRLRLYR